MDLDIAGIVAAAAGLVLNPKDIKAYGFVHKSTAAEINGKKGFLIWDFIVYNEITFKDSEEKITSLFTSISDDETEAVWNELVKKYGI